MKTLPPAEMNVAPEDNQVNRYYEQELVKVQERGYANKNYDE
jgi:hypothetical protein